ncbi:hypothetical protein GCM10010493_78990 [Streptomyces lavendulae subsp. grasserius]
MARLGRPGLSDEEKRELWRRRKDGESLSEIGRAFSRHAGSIFGVVKANGGIVPAERRRRPDALSLAEREESSRGLARQDTFARSPARSAGRCRQSVVK